MCRAVWSGLYVWRCPAPLLATLHKTAHSSTLHCVSSGSLGIMFPRIFCQTLFWFRFPQQEFLAWGLDGWRQKPCFFSPSKGGVGQAQRTQRTHSAPVQSCWPPLCHAWCFALIWKAADDRCRSERWPSLTFPLQVFPHFVSSYFLPFHPSLLEFPRNFLFSSPNTDTGTIYLRSLHVMFGLNTLLL